MNSVEEKRLDSYVRMAKYLAVLRRYYNKNVKEWFFVVGDLVLKWKMNQAVSINSQPHGRGPS